MEKRCWIYTCLEYLEKIAVIFGLGTVIYTAIYVNQAIDYYKESSSLSALTQIMALDDSIMAKEEDADYLGKCWVGFPEKLSPKELRGFKFQVQQV